MGKKFTLTAIASLISLSLAVFWCQSVNAAGQGKKLNVVLIGDSYSAGNGAGDYTGVKNCYRSQRNWAKLYARYLINQNIDVTFQNRACSGSKIEDLYNYRDLKVYDKTIFFDGNLAGRHDALYNKVQQSGTCQAYTVDDSIETRLSVTGSVYLPDINRTKVNYQCFQRLRPQLEFVGPETDLVLMTIGGNDLEFANIVKQCFFFGSRKRCSNLINSASDNLYQLKEKLIRLFRIMRERGLRPDAKVILMGYPLLAMNIRHSIGSPLNPYFVAQEIRKLGLAGNQAQAQAVADDNQKHPGQVIFIDSVPTTFNGHEPHPALFQENPNRWIHEINGFSLLDTHSFYHPNLMGHANYAILLRKLPINQLAKPISKTSSDIDVIFNIDTSGSMSSLLSHARDNIRSIVEQVRTKSSSSRFAITSFRDYHQITGHNRDYPSKVDLDFSSDVNQIQQVLDKLSADGGGDIPETSLSGILAGLNLKWRAGVHKIVITITDAPPHDPEPISGLTSTQIIKRAFEVDPAELYFIDIDSEAKDKPSYKIMADATGGKVFNTTTDLVSDIFIKSIDITTHKPHAWINGPYITKLREPLEMDGGGSYSKVGKIVKYEWDFDSDGKIDFVSNRPIITYTFDKELYGLMTLKVTDDQGLSNVANTHLIVSQDGDDVPTAVDNCPLTDNHDQADSDQDGIGDMCDETPGIELPEENREYFECLIKQHFHPTTQCQHLIPGHSSPNPTEKTAPQQKSTALTNHPLTTINTPKKTSKPKNNQTTQPISTAIPSPTPTETSRNQPTQSEPEIKLKKELNHATPKTTDPKWLWISLPIIMASLFGGYLIIQKLRR